MSAKERIVIVGGGPAGLSTAESYREKGGRGRVTILAAESRPPYARPPLSKDYLRGESDEGDLAMREPAWFKEKEIGLELGTKVRDIDMVAGEATDERGRAWPFDQCVLATGSHPAMPDVPGLDHQAVRTLRRVEDADRLAAESGPGVTVAVVGSGFIGCEAAVSLAARGATVAVITDEDTPQEARLGREVGVRIADWLDEAGVALHAGSALDSVEPGVDAALLLRTEEDLNLEADLAVMALGASRDTALAEGVGLELDNGLVAVDSSMRTSQEGVLAVGDIARAHNELAGRRLAVEHWGEALNHGKAAGAALAGAEDPWATAPGFWSAIGDRTVKQVAWGDGFDDVELIDHGNGAFVARYLRRGDLVGVLTHQRDEDYETGREELEGGSS